EVQAHWTDGNVLDGRKVAEVVRNSPRASAPRLAASHRRARSIILSLAILLLAAGGSPRSAVFAVEFPRWRSITSRYTLTEAGDRTIRAATPGAGKDINLPIPNRRASTMNARHKTKRSLFAKYKSSASVSHTT